jgi:hypothetical protein
LPTIKTKVDDATYATLVTMRKKAGLPSVAALFLSKCHVLTDQAEASEIARRALLRAARRKKNAPEYRLRDLFPKTDWEKYSTGARLRAGKIFQEEIVSGVHGVHATRKSSTNHQLYKTS